MLAGCRPHYGAAQPVPQLGLADRQGGRALI